MPRLQLETSKDKINLDEQALTGLGIQVHAGVVGLGFPPIQHQWLEGAGDGATHRGSRVLPRDLDLPISILGKDRADLKARLSRLALALSGECILRFIEDDGSSWYLRVRRVGGGEYVYGTDTVGERDMQMVITLRSGDPYWTRGEPYQVKLERSSVVRGLLPKLTMMRLSTSQAIGVITLENPGDAPAFPVWTIQGPGRDFIAKSPNGEIMRWAGTLLVGETLTIDTRTGLCVDQSGANRYDEFTTAPSLWLVPPGVNSAEVNLSDATSATQVFCSWNPRRWAVV